MTVLAQRDGVRVVAFNKCGHTSIINTFLSQADKFQNPEPATLDPRDIPYALDGLRSNLIGFNDDWPEPHLVIAFLRDPARRALSAYQHFCLRKERYKFKELGFVFGMSFPAFVDHLLTVDLSLDPHLSPYTPDLIEAGGDRPYTLAPLELIDICWPVIMSDVGLDVPLTVWHKNDGEYYHGDYMTPDLYEVLCELYLEDFGLWSTVYHEAREEIQAIRNEAH